MDGGRYVLTLQKLLLEVAATSEILVPTYSSILQTYYITFIK